MWTLEGKRSTALSLVGIVLHLGLLKTQEYSDTCRIAINDSNAVAIPSYNGTGQTSYSCQTTGISGNFETHVLSIHHSGKANGESLGRTDVHVRGVTDNKSVVLIVANIQPVSWIFHVDRTVQISLVLLMSGNHSRSSLDMSRVHNGANIQVLKESFLPVNFANPKELLRVVGMWFGLVTSFNGAYTSDKWLLNIGGKSNTGTTTKSSTQLTTATVNVPSSTPAVEGCLLSENCWVQFNFTYDDSWNACHGQQYVRRTPYNTGRFIGVVLCSADKYKLLMADHLEDKFLNIGDGSGAGEDLCELVGGQESRAEIPSDFWNSPAVEGFHRAFAGETPMRRKIGFGPKDRSQWTGSYFPTWYKCGVDIPGTSRVVWKGDTTISRTTTPAIPAHLTTLRSNLTTTEQQWIWDNVPHVQTKFSEDRIFIVPEGVTKMDVICIGGGGGGRDGQSKFTGTGKFGGDGGDSLFGSYLVAGGGKGAEEDDTGGEGGHGTVADGGQGGIGGGCSAGAGAAGQTSGGGGGLVAGSSTYPFCGGGASSGGSSCGSEFGTISPGESGPGGVDPKGRAGGLYGGGGGSRAGGRAGGGGGYSRDVINVKPGQRIAITVGQRGTPYYWAGSSAPGIVVISWGGPIDPNGAFVDPTTLSSKAIPSTASPPTTPATSLPRKKCTWGSYCSGGSRLGASCVNGLCQCSAAGYNKYTCLPDVGSCRILPNQRDALGIPTFGGKMQETNSCIGSLINSSYEVHVLGNYENVNHRPPSPGRTNVYIRGQSQKSVVLVVSSYEPVTWVINADVSVNLQMILLYSYYDTLSSIDLVQPANRTTITIEKSRRSSATGDDSGGGDTAGLLKLLTDRFGEVTSFTGSYKADNWELRLTAANARTTLSNSLVTASPSITRITTQPVTSRSNEEICLASADCWLQYNFTYDDSWNACHGSQYVKRTSYSVGRYVGVILCSPTRYKLLMADNLDEGFLNIGDGSGHGQDQCELVGGDESTFNSPSDFWDSPSVKGYSRSLKGEPFLLGNIGFGPKNMSKWTGKYFPTWYECGVSIPGSLVVVAGIGSQTRPIQPQPTPPVTSPGPKTTVMTWDDIPHAQVKFLTDIVFIVPKGVTKVDVICIGGGGGGRDDHAKFAGGVLFGGNGGNSSFGPFIEAEGGKGAKADNTGGEGGHGTVADGGQGGIGGGCSAGAGAAGQTSGGGGGLEAGSSTYPFCGGGGSSGGSSCGSDVASIPAALSGPGGVNPKGRSGGLYGGGGGSRAGGRAGGGGGYSRDVIQVTAGQRILVTVGEKGTPYYWAGSSASGIVVVSWGGPIQPTGTFLNVASVSQSVSTTTQAPTTPATTLPRKRCGMRNYCSGGPYVGASCVGGFCQCSATGYNKYTCLPEVGSCLILPNQNDTAAIPTFRGERQKTHSCLGHSAYSPYNVHVLGNYENVNRRPPSAARTDVHIRGVSPRPTILVVSSYEPVTWVIHADESANLQKVLLYSYYVALSSVNLDYVQGSPNITVEKSRGPSGRGDDSGGGNTTGLLQLLTDRFGSVTSFTGSYKANRWDLELRAPPSTTANPDTTVGIVLTQEECLASSNCWLQYNFTYDDSWNACHGSQYIRRTPYTVGRYIGVILCSSARYKLLMADSLDGQFLNIGDVNGHGQDHCELVGGNERLAKLPSDFWDSPAVKGYSRSNAGGKFVRGNIGHGPKDMSKWTGRYFSTWYECGVTIPGNSKIVSGARKPATTARSREITTTMIPATITSPMPITASTAWDPVPHTQVKFLANDMFTVPEEVTKVDVICIGGGGGGRDNHATYTRRGFFGGNGGNSSFGRYLEAEGGKGAKSDNTGGEGGHGTVADGGQGGIGGGCSAGAGAAGQTSGGGGGLVAGSSIYPFCGGGASSGGSSCGNIFSSIAPGKSGAGGTDPKNRAGGLYGGGGGSRAGARAGGGGGYSRKVIDVTPGEKISVTVGQRGTPYYEGGRSAPGIVVVSWGGQIDPIGTFINPPVSKSSDSSN